MPQHKPHRLNISKILSILLLVSLVHLSESKDHFFKTKNFSWNPFSNGPQLEKKVTTKTTFTYIGGDYTAYSNENLINGIGVIGDDHQLGPLPDAPKAIGRVNYIVSNGTTIYIGGRFREVNKIASANSIIGYNSVDQTWEPLCNGVSGTVSCIAVHGDDVYVAGTFKQVYGCTAKSVINVQNVAKFNVVTQKWATDGRMSLPGATINSIDVTEIDGVRYLYAAGVQYSANQQAAPFVAVWNESSRSWSDLGTELPSEYYNEYLVIASSPVTNEIYLGGVFKSIGGVKDLNNVAKWNATGNQWETLDEGVGFVARVYSIDFIQDGRVVVGGIFRNAGSSLMTAHNIALWDPSNSTWNSMGHGVNGLSFTKCGGVSPAVVHDVCIHDNYVYAIGSFSLAGGLNASNVARYDLNSGNWSTVGPSDQFAGSVLYNSDVNFRGDLFAIGQEVLYFDYSTFEVDGLVFSQYAANNDSWISLSDDVISGFLDSGKIRAVIKNGTDIYVGGSFSVAGNKIIHNVAKWNGDEWLPLGDGITNGIVHTLAVDGDDLYVGGFFNSSVTFPETYVNGSSQNITKQLISIAKYNDPHSYWDSLSGGVKGDCNYNNTVNVIYVAGDYVYVGGSFVSMGMVDSSSSSSAALSANIARWNRMGDQWEPMGKGIVGIQADSDHTFVTDLLLNDTTLWISGKFIFNYDEISPNFTAHNLALWSIESNSWVSYPGVTLTSAFSEGFVNNFIDVLAKQGNNIIIGGRFDNADSVTVNNIAFTTNGLDWNGIGAGLTSSISIASVHALGMDNDKEILYVGGVFSDLGNGVPTDNVAQYSLNTSTWTTISSQISQWEGPVYTIEVSLVMETIDVASSNTPSVPTSYKIIGATLIAALASFIAVGVVAFVVIRYRKRRAMYIEIPSYPPTKKLSLKDLANDAAIKQIEPSEISLGERIALGASGEVIKGTWKGREIAVKRMAFRQNQMTQKFMDDFLYEIKIMSTLDHKNILKFMGASITSSGEVLLLTEYMEHGSVKDLLDKTQGKLDWKLKIRLAIDAARGMEYLHSCQPPIIHRDLKAGNLLIDKRWRCKISDFGISRIKPTSQQTMTLVGTPAYMAPEVINQNRYSEKADVYSFGVVLCELQSGETPYADSDLFPEQVMYAVVHEGLRPTIPEDCPSALAVLIKDCLHADPVKRPQFKEIKLRLKRL